MAIICAGWGYITAKLCKLNIQYMRIEQLWIGFAVILSILEIVHFFFRINWVTTVILFILGAFFLLDQINQYRRSIKIISIKQKIQRSLLTLIFFIFLTLWSLKAMEPPINYDSGLYHFNSIRWINEHSLVAGLGNLHNKLAFNQSWFAFVALMNVDPIFAKGYAIAGLFLLTLGVFQIISACKNNNLTIIALPIFFYAIFLNLWQISSPSPDIPVDIIEIVISTLLLNLICIKSANKIEGDILLTTIAALCISLTTIKLSGAAFGATSLVIGILILRSSLTKKRLWIILLLCVTLCLPHILRGYFLSGAPFYPSTFGLLDKFEWSMSKDAVQEMANWINAWSRNPGPDFLSSLGNWNWIAGWWKNFSNRIFFILLISFLFLIFPLFFKKKIFFKNHIIKVYIFCIPSIVSLIIWFFNAPNQRFLGSIPYIMLGLSTAILFNFFIKNKKNIIKKRHLYITSFLLLIAFHATYRAFSTDKVRLIISSGFQPIPVVRLIKQTTNSGLIIYSPENGDQCYDSRLPCTPFFKENLRLEKDKTNFTFLYFTIK
jgi:hypothetical protein